MPRSPKYEEKMERKNIHLPPKLEEYARKVGDGQLAEGVRKCIEAHRERQSSSH